MIVCTLLYINDLEFFEELVNVSKNNCECVTSFKIFQET